jgi:dCTP deaminase
MARGSDAGELYWGYSIGTGGRVMVTLLDAPRFIGRDALLEVTLDSGVRIHATPDHFFMRRNGLMVEARSLRPGDALMPLYRDLARGYEVVYQPSDGHMHLTHRLADEWNLRHEIYADTPGTHRHHRDFDRRNNRPSNIERMAASEHIRLHNAESYGEDFDPQAHGAAIQASLFPDVLTDFRGLARYLNHKVAAVRDLPGEHDVYCLTVPEAGNFALEAGVFVRNCGIIVNVTPLEPEWEGHVTLEFSNTTPLPAKIYANEGVAQMLFFESDEVCATSYKDRGGKYQGQRGVTLPKT